MDQRTWRAILFMMFFAILFNGYNFLHRDEEPSAEISYSRFRHELAADNLKKVEFKGTEASGEFLERIQIVETVQGEENIREVFLFTGYSGHIRAKSYVSVLYA